MRTIPYRSNSPDSNSIADHATKILIASTASLTDQKKDNSIQSNLAQTKNSWKAAKQTRKSADYFAFLFAVYGRYFDFKVSKQRTDYTFFKFYFWSLFMTFTQQR